jgi:apolipoprotein N-acyltransferase
MKLKSLFSAGFIGDMIALLAGALLTLSFAPFNAYPLAIVSPAVLLGEWLYVTKRRAFYRGFLYGLGLFGTGVYWVYISIHTFGEAPVWLSVFITVGFVAILALFPAFTGYFLNRYFPVNNFNKTVLAFPTYWILLEWARSWLFSGFPWLSLGYSQMNSWLRGWATILSVYGVSLGLLLTSSLLVTCIFWYKEQQFKPIMKSLFFIIAMWVLGGLILLVNWSHPYGTPLTVSLVQGNIPQSIKWSPEAVQPTLDRYHSLTNNHWDSNIIIWPEGAIPVPLPAASGIIDKLNQEAVDHHATLITGIPSRAGLSHDYYNTVVTLGKEQTVYIKFRLVPFGEFTPFSRYLKPLLSHLNIPMSDFIPGPVKPAQLRAANINISAFICYEIAFPEQVNRRVDSGFLLTVSDDAWFGHSIAQAQHLQMAQMRSLELAKPQFFVGNDGLTAFINQKGLVTDIAPPFEPYVLTAKVRPYMGATPWQLFGMDPLLFGITIMLILAVYRNRRARTSR